jgi:aryl-alcohol dehydrogenase-like predicted oxidoreductase
VQAREEGLVRYISITSHTDPQILVEALNRFPFDSALIALSALDHFILSFAEEFLPVANAKGVATIGMKVLGLGSLTHEVERSLRYAFGLPVSTVVVGMETMAQLEQNLAIAESRWSGRTRCVGKRLTGTARPSGSLAAGDCVPKSVSEEPLAIEVPGTC